MEVAMACFFLQMKSILHRDLKSQNILLADNYRAKLCDLGLARALDTASRRLTFVGTDVSCT
jgi:serine/threonine protein kinase